MKRIISICILLSATVLIMIMVVLNNTNDSNNQMIATEAIPDNEVVTEETLPVVVENIRQEKYYLEASGDQIILYDTATNKEIMVTDLKQSDLSVEIMEKIKAEGIKIIDTIVASNDLELEKLMNQFLLH